MKKGKAIVGIAAACAAIGLTACGNKGFNPELENQEAIYGPPEYFDEEIKDEDGTGDTNGDTSGPAIFDPELENPVDVYGPPEFFDQ